MSSYFYIQSVIVSIFIFILGAIINSNINWGESEPDEKTVKISINTPTHFFALVLCFMVVMSLKYINIIISISSFVYSVYSFMKHKEE